MFPYPIGRRGAVALPPAGLLLIAALMLAAAPMAPARADADGPDHFRVVHVRPGGALNMRAGPSTADARIGRIPAAADGLVNLGCKGGLAFAEWQKASPDERAAAAKTRWCRIGYNGATGWVAARYLAESSLPAAPQPALPGSAWRLPGGSEAGEAWIAFSEGGEVTGFSGCNRFGGRVETGAAAIAFSPLHITRMACAGEGRAGRETRFLAALGKAARYTIAGDTLTLRDAADAPLLTLERRAGG